MYIDKELIYFTLEHLVSKNSAIAPTLAAS
jgi:hypothetical protein